VSKDKAYDGPNRRNEDDYRRMVQEVAEEAAHKAVEETLEKLGIDPDEHKEVQKDMIWMRKYREMSEKIGSRVLLTAFTLLTVGIAGAVWSQVSGK